MPQPPLRALRLANPLVRAVLTSRAHRLLSGSLVVLSYRGPRSGRAFRIPLRYAEMPDGGIVALAVRPERKLWWRSFIEPVPVTLVLRGRQVAAVGALVEGDVRERALAEYVAKLPRGSSLARGAAVVVFYAAS